MLCFLALLVFLIYSNTLEGPFVFDDVLNIQNPNIRISQLTLETIGRAAFESHVHNRPVANISFALNYYFHRYEVLGYHLINILIHVMAGIFLYLLAKTTLSLPPLDSRYEAHRWIPFITVLIWAVHPIQIQSVTYTVQRMTGMAAMFYVSSLLLYARARLAKQKRRKSVLFGGCILSGVLSLGSKEIAATLPFFIFLYEWYFFQDLSWSWAKRHLLPLVGLLILFAVLASIYLGGHPLEKISETYEARDFSLTQRVLTESRVVIYYISLLVFPHPSRLNLDHDFPLSYSLTDPITTLLSIGAIIGSIAMAIHMAKKERLLSFCILWFFGNLVIESSVIGLEIMFEHRNYLPSMLVSLMAVTLACRYMKPKWVRVGVLCVVVSVISVWTHQRNKVWSDDVTLWRDCAEKSPGKARPHNNLGFLLNKLGEFEEAIVHFSEALRIEPDYAEAHNNFGVALEGQGRLKEAIDHYSEAVRIKPDFAEPRNNLGLTLARQGRLEEAVIHFSEALRINPGYAEAYNNLGVALKKQERYEEAMSHYLEALRIKPDYPEAHTNLGVLLKRQGRIAEAISHYKQALRIEPNYPEAHNNLGNALKSEGRLEEAIVHFSEALRIKPDYAEACNNLGVALAKQRRFREAASYFSKALRIKPDYVEANRNLGLALRLIDE